MIDTEPTVSLENFQSDALSHLARLRETGDAEVLTVGGEAAAVMLSPGAYASLRRELELSRQHAGMERAMREHAEGKGRPVDEVFADIRAAIMAKAKESA